MHFNANLSRFQKDRTTILGQRGGVVWFTGLSGSGKSTLSQILERRLLSSRHACYILDGDVLRTGLCQDLGFTAKDREENVRRAGAVAALFADAGIIAIVALISPFIKDRQRARALLPSDSFIEVHLSTSLTVCERRDPKGLYLKARCGQLPHFTGVDDPYEVPTSPDLRLDTELIGPDACVDEVMRIITQAGLILSAK